MSYSNSSTSIPTEAAAGGRGKYCCIPMCSSAQYDKDKNKTKIALFGFPNKEKKPDVYKSWCKEIYKYRRKGAGDNFNITRHTKVCEFHFKPEEIKVSLGRGIKTLKTGNEIPSVFSFKEDKQTLKRKSPKKRLVLPPNTDNESDIDMDIMPPFLDINQEDTCENCESYKFQITVLEKKLETSEQKAKELLEQNNNLEQKNNYLSNRLFTCNNYLKNGELFKSATGIEKEKFMILYEYLDPGENCENVKLYEKSKTNTEDKIPDDPMSSPSFLTRESKHGPRPKTKAIEQLFMFLNGYAWVLHCNIQPGYLTLRNQLYLDILSHGQIIYILNWDVCQFGHQQKIYKRQCHNVLRTLIPPQKLLLIVLNFFVRDHLV